MHCRLITVGVELMTRGGGDDVQQLPSGDELRRPAVNPVSRHSGAHACLQVASTQGPCQGLQAPSPTPKPTHPLHLPHGVEHLPHPCTCTSTSPTPSPLTPHLHLPHGVKYLPHPAAALPPLPPTPFATPHTLLPTCICRMASKISLSSPPLTPRWALPSLSISGGQWGLEGGG